MIWEHKKLGDVIVIKKGAYITKKDAKEGPYPVILGGKEPAYYIDQFNHEGKAIVISRSGASAGYVSFWNEPIFITDGFLIEPQDGIDHDFLYYLVKSRQPQLQGLQGGAAIPHVNPRVINAIDVYVPEMQTQCAIVQIISKYDVLIENVQKQIKLLEESAQRLYKEWFVDLRFPGYENNTVIDGIPMGWKKEKLSNVVRLLRRGISPIYDDNGRYTVISQKCIRQSIMDISESRKESKPYQTIYGLQDEDTVICSTGNGTLGRVGQVFGKYENTTFDSHVTLVRADTSKIGNEYLYRTIKSKQQYLMSMGRGSTNQQELYKSVIEELEVILPEQDVMDGFEKIAREIHDKVSALNQQGRLLLEARDRLLPKLMSGEIEI